MNENYFMGLDGFVWFTGVVENRNDPAKLGRVQVRCLGYHTSDLLDIPSADLPWAHIMMPVTDPSMQGLGNSPSFLTEGTWVVGFFRDANEKQQPVILGSLPGVPASVADVTKGYNDPNGKYPGTIEHSSHTIEESDVSRLARSEDGETHDSLIKRRATKVKDIPIATKPNVSTVSTNTSEETAGKFSEPDARGVSTTGTTTGQYPFNHVHESESGHIQEIDDTPGGERLHREHKSGTYEEIVADGTKTVKVVGDNYELIAGANNIFVNGNINLTCNGDKRELIKGDYVLEVGGNFTRKIFKSEQVKIGAGKEGGNLEEEIKGNHGFNISNSVSGAIGTTTTGTAKDFDISVGGSFGTTVGGEHFITSVGNMNLTSSKSFGVISVENIDMFSVAGTSIAAGTSLDMKSVAKMSIKSEAIIDMDATTEVDIDSALINLN